MLAAIPVDDSEGYFIEFEKDNFRCHNQQFSLPSLGAIILNNSMVFYTV
jgi:hypothetical protein